MGLCPVTAKTMRPGPITYATGMGRWEPDAQQRLVSAALDLFVEKGYDDTAVAAALESVAVAFTPEGHMFASQRREVIAANPELEERDPLKRARIAAAMTQALRARGVSDLTASIAAELGVLAFRNAFARWAERSNQQFGELARESLEELQTASALLT